ncbi:MAG: hypothetical protein GY747_04535 [Planctomycetes bacterium]|nr:hypothetical protein [Planctomycetota bacterium]MCP4861137.1 hypothetical protein [Planctomycetota bacterium]
MIFAVLQNAGRPLFAALLALSCISAGFAQDLQRRPLTEDDQLALNALQDDDIRGNCATAFAQLFDRGSAAKQTLLSGLDSEDWQQRFLSAALLSPLKLEEAEFDQVCRILIGHLPDNQIRGDALLVGHALIALGPKCFGYLHAASWHADGQLAAQCKLLKRAIGVGKSTDEKRERAIVALANYTVSLKWLGDGVPTAPALSAPIPSESQRRQQAFIDLASDRRRGNALRGYGVLTPWRRSYSQKSSPKVDDELISLLENALLDSDRQRRLMAGYSLMQSNRPPSTALFRVAMESLKLDDFHGWARRGVPFTNARQAKDFFLQHPDEGRPFLMAGLSDKSYAVRLRCAGILARMRDWQTERYVPILLEHLANNGLACDATLAAESLAFLGKEALPWLDREPVDQQQAHYFSVIRRSIAILERDPDARIPISPIGMILYTKGDGY